LYALVLGPIEERFEVYAPVLGSASTGPARRPSTRTLGVLQGVVHRARDFVVAPVARKLVELHLARGRPPRASARLRDSGGGHLRRQNWRRRVWIPALERAGVPYFRSYDLRHTCATLLLYEGRTLNEVAEHVGHADPGFTDRTYAHVMRRPTAAAHHDH
jgi:integrase